MPLIPIAELPGLCPSCSQLPDACKTSCSVALEPERCGLSTGVGTLCEKGLK